MEVPFSVCPVSDHLPRCGLEILVVALLTLLLLGAIYVFFFRRTSLALGVANRTCLVSGGAAGIGAAVVLELARRGARRVVVFDVKSKEQTRQDLLDQIRRAGSDCELVFVQGDVTSSEDLARLWEATRALGVAMVVNTAGVVSGKPFSELDRLTFERVIAINLTGMFGLIKLYLPQMLERGGGGSFVATSSLMGLMGGAQLADYCASKFALVGMMEALRVEHRNTKVCFTTVCPYAVDTGMFDGIFLGTRWTRLIRRLFPLLRPRDVARDLVDAAERGLFVAIVPWYLSPLINVLRCCPSPLYEYVLEFMGGTDGMKAFTGRGLARAAPET